jgi:hypothetical protein
MLPPNPIQSLSVSLVLDQCSGKLYRVFLDQSYLLWFLWNTCLDCEKMATLHCVLSCGQDPCFLEDQVRTWFMFKCEQTDNTKWIYLVVK